MRVKFLARFVAWKLLALAVVVVCLAAGCAEILGQQCTGDPTKWSCSCNGSQDPACPAPLNDDNPPWAQDAKRPDAGTPKGTP